MAGFYDTLESISDNIDWFIDDAVWRYNKLGWELVLIPNNRIISRLALDLVWAKEELEACEEGIGRKDWPEAKYNALAAHAAVDLYRKAYNKHKYFWMRSI